MARSHSGRQWFTPNQAVLMTSKTATKPHRYSTTAESAPTPARGRQARTAGVTPVSASTSGTWSVLASPSAGAAAQGGVPLVAGAGWASSAAVEVSESGTRNKELVSGARVATGALATATPSAPAPTASTEAVTIASSGQCSTMTST